MKKVLLVCVMICSAVTASAQQEETNNSPTSKGHFIVDGSATFSINNSEFEGEGGIRKSNSFGLGVSPKAAYFVIDRLAVGLETFFGYSDREFTNPDGEKNSGNSTSISVGPFARYYLVNGLFGEASVGIGTNRSKSEGNVSNRDSFRYQLGVGYAIFLGSQVSVEPIISYRHSKNTSGGSSFKSTNNGFSLGAGFTIYL